MQNWTPITLLERQHFARRSSLVTRQHFAFARVFDKFSILRANYCGCQDESAVRRKSVTNIGRALLNPIMVFYVSISRLFDLLCVCVCIPFKCSSYGSNGQLHWLEFIFLCCSFSLIASIRCGVVTLTNVYVVNLNRATSIWFILVAHWYWYLLCSSGIRSA